jgi:twitching motility two-component system response regulator PilG
MPKVLVVDSSVAVRKVVERALAARGIEVESASSGSEALSRLGEITPDLVVCDVLMPDLDGYQFCERLRRHPAVGHAPVLLMAGTVNEAVLGRAAAARSSDVIQKPFTAEELLGKVTALIDTAGRAAAAAPAPAAAAAPALEAEAAELEPATAVARLASLPGVSLVVLADRDGLVIESGGGPAAPAEAAGALAACLAEASDGLGGELGLGPLRSMILEYETAVVLVHEVGEGALVAVGLQDLSALGKVRYYLKRWIPAMAAAL